jgi:para-aminobenzoate synthetase
MRYDLEVECGISINRQQAKTPDACFFFSDNVVAIDHRCDEVYILSLQDEITAETKW